MDDNVVDEIVDVLGRIVNTDVRVQGQVVELIKSIALILQNQEERISRLEGQISENNR